MEEIEILPEDPQMGQIARIITDKIIITHDNPRNELPNLIWQQIIQGIGVDNSHYLEIADRKIFIIQTINNLKKNAILINTSKGDEEYQIIQNNKFKFSDFEVAKKILLTYKQFLSKK